MNRFARSWHHVENVAASLLQFLASSFQIVPANYGKGSASAGTSTFCLASSVVSIGQRGLLTLIDMSDVLSKKIINRTCRKSNPGLSWSTLKLEKGRVTSLLIEPLIEPLSTVLALRRQCCGTCFVVSSFHPSNFAGKLC